jgi:hypothetical protein
MQRFIITTTPALTRARIVTAATASTKLKPFETLIDTDLETRTDTDDERRETGDERRETGDERRETEASL